MSMTSSNNSVGGGEHNNCYGENNKQDEQFMKEGDAEILERGVRDSAVETTPVLVSHHHQSSTGLPDVPSMVLNESRSSSSSAVEKDAIDEAGALLAQVESLNPSSDRTEHARRVYRRCLSGDIRPREHNHDEEEGTDASPESVVDELQQLLASELKAEEERKMNRLMNEVTQYAEAVGDLPPDESHVQGIIEDEESDLDDYSNEAVEIEEFMEARSIENDIPERSDSFARKLQEAAQYAEAVGEMPPSSEIDMREIIEDGGSQSTDDSGVHVEHSLSVPSTPKQKHLHKESNGGSVDQSVVQGDTPVKPELARQKSRPRWPFREGFDVGSTFLHKLPDGVSTQDFVYKGICSNPPEVTKHGIQRGNYAQLHRKAWLEVSDKYHRYGKNLRLYYRYWERLGFPHNSFFDWLDSKGEAAGMPLPNLEECPRSQLDSDTVLYITNTEVTERYALKVVPEEGTGRGLVIDVDNDPVQTGPDGWIFILRDNVLYGAQKITSVTGHSKQRFHHSSFFGGKAVAAAGILITDDDGYLVRLFPHSGHYRPGEAHMQRVLFYLHHNGVSLRTFDLDTQQIFKVNRESQDEKKKKKVDCLYPMPAIYVASFLAHKARFIDAGIFAQIHKIRKADVTSVTEALAAMDDVGLSRRGKDEQQQAPCEKEM